MTVPRVQPIDRLSEDESGRWPDCIVRRSGYADMYEDRGTLTPCQFASQPGQCTDYDDGHASLNLGLFSGEHKNPFGQFVSPSFGHYDVSVCCAEPPSVPILSASCSQFPDCTVNDVPTTSRSCQLGPIDVEDLALYFDQDKSQTNRLSRLYRPVSQQHFRRARSKGSHYSTAVPPKEVPSFPPNDVFREKVDLGRGGWLGEQICDGCPQNFAFCTEERWLQCPASDRCSLYDQSGVLPPCAYENLQNEYWHYNCNQDEQLLEDYLSNEKRKEKSRDAARYRRSKETDIFTELAAALPVPPEQAAHLDKASVMRLAIAYLRVRSVVDTMSAPLLKSETSKQMDKLFSKALNGFMLVLSSDGSMVYLSENVSDYLGVCQLDMMGQSVYEYSHPCDHEEVRECLSSKPTENKDNDTCSFFLRLKCTLTNKGRKVNLKSASYKVIHCIGRLTYISNPVSSCMESDDEERKNEDDDINESNTGACLILVGCPIPHPSNIEIPLGRHTFLSKHNLSMKFTYADEKLAEYLGWNSEDLMGQSVFEFYHALDNLALGKSFKSLFSKGQCETLAYRFLGKRGGYAWVVTQATLIHCLKQQKPLSVVCVNYILSGVEHEDEVYSVRQLAARDTERNVVKPEKPVDSKIVSQPSKLQLRVQVRSKKLVEVGLDSSENEYSSSSTVVEDKSTGSTIDRTKPLTVTTSTFRATGQKAEKESVRVQDGSRKDNTFPRPVHDTEKFFVGVEGTKDSVQESVKENEEPKRKQQIRNRAAGRAPFIFQGKPALEYDPKATVRRNRPQAVTRHLFAPISDKQQQQQQQPQQQQQQEQITAACRPPPQTTTASTFAPRTEDMNKGFLTFSEDHPGLTMLKDEPEDLTHLAPTPGDVCVPLEDTPFLTDMLDEFILSNDNYCPLLSPGGALAPELRSSDFGDPLKDTDLGDSSRDKSLGESLPDSDPFIYGDSPESPCSIDPTSVSPSFAKYRQSPERSVDSLGSPTGGSGTEGLSEDEMLMLGLSDSIADDELALRAPYIPMSDQDEALGLLISNDMVMWSPPQTTDKTCPKWMLEEKEHRPSDSSTVQLLKTDHHQVLSRKYNDHGGGLVNPVQVLGQIPRKNTSLDTGHWSSKLDSPTKRIHAASIDTVRENKRIKCDESTRHGAPLILEDHLLRKQQLASRKSTSIGGSQLLRRLVSEQTVQRVNGYSSESLESLMENRGQSNSNRMPTELDAVDEGEWDSGGGGGGGNEGGRPDDSHRRQTHDATRNTLRQTTTPGCNSVLMNLLVSGCDENLINSRIVPTARPSLTSALSVNLDNQTVPQCALTGESNMSYDQFSSDARKNLLPDSFIGERGSSLAVSPSSTMISFDNFDYDPTMSTSGLLQVQPDLFGSLLDRNIV